MKVSRATPPKEFVPIQITIETKAEAEMLWHMLNLPTLALDRIIGPSRKYRFEPHAGLHMDMWRAFNEAYDPDYEITE